MPTPGTIVFVEDDIDDLTFLHKVSKELEIYENSKFFNDGQEAFSFLINSSKENLIVISDINMRGMNGIELRNQILDHPLLKTKNIFFVFLTSDGSPHYSIEANAREHQGYLIKPTSFGELKILLNRVIFDWKASIKTLHFT